MYPQQFGNQWQQPFTGFQPQFQQQQQYQPTMSQNVASRGISGRLVASVDDIAANEVPMNGSVAFFPVADGSAIFARTLNPDFTVSEIKYVPVQKEQDDQPEQQQQFTIVDVMNQLSDIQDLLKAEKKPAPKRTAAKKEAADDTSE